jgi:hypothetical protein
VSAGSRTAAKQRKEGLRQAGHGHFFSMHQPGHPHVYRPHSHKSLSQAASCCLVGSFGGQAQHTGHWLVPPHSSYSPRPCPAEPRFPSQMLGSRSAAVLRTGCAPRRCSALQATRCMPKSGCSSRWVHVFGRGERTAGGRGAAAGTYEGRGCVVQGAGPLPYQRL